MYGVVFFPARDTVYIYKECMRPFTLQKKLAVQIPPVKLYYGDSNKIDKENISMGFFNLVLAISKISNLNSSIFLNNRCNNDKVSPFLANGQKHFSHIYIHKAACAFV